MTKTTIIAIILLVENNIVTPVSLFCLKSPLFYETQKLYSVLVAPSAAAISPTGATVAATVAAAITTTVVAISTAVTTPEIPTPVAAVAIIVRTKVNINAAMIVSLATGEFHYYRYNRYDSYQQKRIHLAASLTGRIADILRGRYHKILLFLGG
ncbi:hypothetical protein GJ688_05985 [Heliobacillus mobilis]|uniref:Uncharacterized protein n=1 Tax=Heliobacterium mobile TaxID=28064 RepID=A0A6I3SI37_HELMO|nr:hypothetical protein [Heliobacterium mobile]MTV48531.1 hypothetical protein [Heliobacterium mobile]